MTPRPHVGPQRRREILDAAAQVFARLGFARARMEDIAQQAGLSKATLYLYFRSKEALFQALLDRLFRREAKALEQALASHGQPVPQRLRHLFAEVLARLAQYRPLLPLFYEVYALAARHRTVREAIQAYYRTYADLLAQLLREGMERGEIRPGDPHRLAVALIAHIEGVILLWVMAPQVVDLESQWQTSTDLMLRSLLPDGAAAPPAQETLP